MSITRNNIVIFAEETKIKLLVSVEKTSIWTKSNEELKFKNIKATIKSGGGGVMFWGCVSSAGLGNTCRQRLPANPKKFNINSNYLFYHDNDPKNTIWSSVLVAL